MTESPTTFTARDLQRMTFPDPDDDDQRRTEGFPIIHSSADVPCDGEPLTEPILWIGRQWAVTAYGIEAHNGTYAIAHDRLGERTGSGTWPRRHGSTSRISAPPSAGREGTSSARDVTALTGGSPRRAARWPLPGRLSRGDRGGSLSRRGNSLARPSKTEGVRAS